MRALPDSLTLLALAGALLANAAGAAPPPETRTVLSLDRDWRFHRGDVPGAGMGQPIATWRSRPADRADAALESAPQLQTAGEGWIDAKPGDDVFHGRRGFAWFVTALPAAAAERPSLHFESVDDNAAVYLNGKLLRRHQGWNDPFDVPLAGAWEPGKPNVLAVLVENTDGPGGIGPAALEGLPETAAPRQDPRAHAYDDRAWRQVDVPHDYVVEGTFDPKANKDHGFLPVEPAWYRKSLRVPSAAKGRRLWLEFDGVFRDSRVWLNGTLLGRHPSGYTPFRYDITSTAKPGADNQLTVRVDPTHFEGWWYEGGGIYRHVRLVMVDPVHVEPWGVFVSASVPDPGDGRQAEAAVTVKSTVANEGPRGSNIRLVSEVLDAAGGVVASHASERPISSGGKEELTQELKLPKARLWAPEHPVLYTLRTTVQAGGKTVDQVTTPFGVRTFRFDPDRGFFLNGKPLKLKGTCNHQDFAGVGIALPDRLYSWRIEKLLEMGSNAYRCSHNPVAAELLDACDRLGMLVMDENRQLGDTYAGKAPKGTPAEDLSDLKTMVLRDRNHPSIVLWSLCNEEPLQGIPEGGRIGAAMKKVVNQLDGTRPVTAAMNGGYEGKGGLSSVIDLEGFNYNPGAYAAYHRAHPGQPLFGSETASAVGTRGIYVTDREKGYVSAYDVNAPPWAQTAEVAWRAIAEKPYMAGCFVWTGFDYKGEPTPYAWPCINSHFGVMDMCGFPKDSWWYYRSWWTHQPVLHVLPHWNWPGKEGQEIDVWCFSNCQRVELFLNGRSLGAQAMHPNGHLQWRVKYEPGTLLAKGIRDGRELTDKIETTGAPYAVELRPDRSQLTPDGSDVSLVTVRILDKQGRVVPVADNELTFKVEGAGKLLGVGNGDPSSHESDKASKRRAFNGVCLALVQAGRSRGTITLTATAPGLQAAAVRLRAE